MGFSCTGSMSWIVSRGRFLLQHLALPCFWRMAVWKLCCLFVWMIPWLLLFAIGGRKPAGLLTASTCLLACLLDRLCFVDHQCLEWCQQNTHSGAQHDTPEKQASSSNKGNSLCLTRTSKVNRKRQTWRLHREEHILAGWICSNTTLGSVPLRWIGSFLGISRNSHHRQHFERRRC